MRQKWLLLSFIEGAAVMSAELCGARLLAPVFGSSLNVWATAMGFTLFALAAGYFIGGLISSKSQKPEHALRKVLSYAALIIISMPLVAHYLVPRISYLPFTPGMILSAAVLLLPAIFLLGASSPLFIHLQTNNNSGRISGTVYAVSTVGGIIATFLCGFYLIPDMGLTGTLLLNGFLLLFGTLLVFKTISMPEIFLAALFAYLNYQVLKGRTAVIESSDSILGAMKVFDVRDNGVAKRILTINDIVQSEMRLPDGSSGSEYMQLLDTLIPEAGKNAKAMVLGLGAGLSANMLVKKKFNTTGIEFDERIASAAQKHFNLDKEVTVVVDDARHYLNASNEKFELVLADLYKAEEQPSHVFTLESLKHLHQQLTAEGKIIISWHGYLQGRAGEGSRILLNTLKAAGYYVRICSMNNDEAHRNLIFIASSMPLKVLPHEVALNGLHSDLVNTDDHPVLEKYNSEANKLWRTSYLRYYQGLN